MWWPSAPFRLAVLAFVVSVAHWPAIFSAPYMPRWWAIAAGLPLLFGLGRWEGETRIGMLALAGMAWGAVACALSEAPLTTLVPLYLTGLLIVAAGVGSTQRDFSPVMVGFAAGAAMSSAVAVAQIAGWSAIPMVGAAPGGLFYNSEVLAEFAAPLLVWAIVARRWGFVVALAVPLALCQSRIAVLAVAVGLLWAWKPAWRLAKPLVIVALTVAAIAAIMLLGPEKFDSAWHRLVLWGAALHSLTPLGSGLGWWASAHPFAYEEFVHSDALQWLVEIGPGALFFIAVPVLIFWRRIADRALGGCFAALCFEALVSFPLQVPATGFLFAVLAGHLARPGSGLRFAEHESGVDRGADLRRAIPFSPGMAEGR